MLAVAHLPVSVTGLKFIERVQNEDRFEIQKIKSQMRILEYAEAMDQEDDMLERLMEAEVLMMAGDNTTTIEEVLRVTDDMGHGTQAESSP